MTDVTRALIVVDVQNDFVPGGTLPVPDGDRVVPIVNSLIENGKFDLIVATQDWHPPLHRSFAANHHGRSMYDVIDLNGLPQVLWPVHCVQQTLGADFVPLLNVSRVDRVFQKGTDPNIDSYSGFFDNGHRKATGLGDYLRDKHVDEVYVCGLATDYCVKFTALDARKLGFATFLIADASRGVNIQAGDVDRAVEEMKSAGVQAVLSSQLLRDR